LKVLRETGASSTSLYMIKSEFILITVCSLQFATLLEKMCKKKFLFKRLYGR
jgi:hypothetical protein